MPSTFGPETEKDPGRILWNKNMDIQSVCFGLSLGWFLVIFTSVVSLQNLENRLNIFYVSWILNLHLELELNLFLTWWNLKNRTESDGITEPPKSCTCFGIKYVKYCFQTRDFADDQVNRSSEIKKYYLVPGTGGWFIELCGCPFLRQSLLMESWSQQFVPGDKVLILFHYFLYFFYNISHLEVIFHIFYTETYFIVIISKYCKYQMLQISHFSTNGHELCQTQSHSFRLNITRGKDSQENSLICRKARHPFAVRIHIPDKLYVIPCNLLSTKAAGPEQIRPLNNSLSQCICGAFWQKIWIILKKVYCRDW